MGARRAPAHLVMSQQDMQQMLQFDREVDARGLNCPLPVLRTKKTLNDMSSGEVLHILATDPASVRDFQAFAIFVAREVLRQFLNLA